MATRIERWRLITAGIVAVCADVVQWLLLPAGSFMGILDPVAADQILDIAVAGVMVSLLGYHVVFIPSVLGKLVPFVDMMPFWTGAVFWVATGQDARKLDGENLPGEYLPTLEAKPLDETESDSAALLPATPVTQPIGEAKTVN